MKPRSLIAAIHPRLAVVVHDMAMVWVAWTAVSMLRWSLAPNPSPVTLFGTEVWLVLAAQGAIFWWTGLYKGLWRFASLPDLWNIAKAAVLGALAIAITLFLYNRLATVPRTVLTIYPLVLAVLLGAPRLLYRYWKDSRLDFSARAPSQRVLVLGAGKAGEALVRDLRRENRYLPVGFLDDKHSLRGSRVHGVPVLGALSCRRSRARPPRRCSSSRCRPRVRPRCAARSISAKRAICRSARCRGSRTSSPDARASTS
jgi:FlaA1/EpsC-like NDP-sugar epimerase